MFAGARGLDGGVEREEVGLLGDFADDGGDAPDLPHLLGEPSHLSGGGFHVPGDAFDLGRCGRHRLATVLGAQAGVAGLLVGVLCARGNVVDADRHFLDRGGRRGGGRRLAFGALGDALRGVGELSGGVVDFASVGGDLGDRLRQVGAHAFE